MKGQGKSWKHIEIETKGPLVSRVIIQFQFQELSIEIGKKNESLENYNQGVKTPRKCIYIQ